jgi:drug/metabolite transporter (DMT)-like permease
MSDATEREAAPSSARVAEAVLLFVTIVWGTSFALAKESGAAVNAAADAPGSPLGPVMILAIRFTFGAVIVAIAMTVLARRPRTAAEASDLHLGQSPTCKYEAPASDDQLVATPASDARSRLLQSITLGALLVVGTILQHLALDRTSEAAAAFLTSLTVIFVPLILWLATRRAPTPAAWVGVAVAVPGVWLMGGGTSSIGLGVGEALGVGCAIVFAGHLLAVGRYGATLGALRACLAQFAGVAIVCVPLTFALIAHAERFDENVLSTRAVWGNVLLLIAGPTLVSFLLMAAYQPRVTPVRAALIYLLEPVFAAMFAWFWSGRSMTAGEFAGGALILVANVIVEAWPNRRQKSE